MRIFIRRPMAVADGGVIRQFATGEIVEVDAQTARRLIRADAARVAGAETASAPAETQTVTAASEPQPVPATEQKKPRRPRKKSAGTKAAKANA